jgi:hypothetical protein
MLLIDTTLLCVCYHHLVLIMLKMSEINIFYCTVTVTVPPDLHPLQLLIFNIIYFILSFFHSALPTPRSPSSSFSSSSYSPTWLFLFFFHFLLLLHLPLTPPFPFFIFPCLPFISSLLLHLSLPLPIFCLLFPASLPFPPLLSSHPQAPPFDLFLVILASTHCSSAQFPSVTFSYSSSSFLLRSFLS